MWASVLTISRIVLAFSIFNEIIQHNWFLASLLIFLGSLTDFFDGWIARQFNQKTKVGAHLDHISDKIFVLLSLYAFYLTGKVEITPLILLAFREISITILRFYSFASPVGFLGKIKTTLEFISLIFLCYSTNLGNVLLWISIVIAYFSAFIYIWKPLKANF